MKRFRKTIRNPETFRHKKKKENTIQYDYYLDLHGFTGDDAVFKVKNLISLHKDAVLLIVHGKGSGTLKLRIRHFLSTHPQVKKVLFGENLNLPEGEGVTIVHV